MYEVWDRRRQELVGLAHSKTEAIELGTNALKLPPKRDRRDLIVRLHIAPPLRVFNTKWQPTSKPRKHHRN